MSFFELSAIYISFLTVVLVIGFIKFDKKIKKKIMLVLSTIYNIAMGYVDTVFLLVTYAFLSNSYEVPESDAGFNMILGIILLTLYIFLLIPLNIFMKKKSNTSMKYYVIINVIATIGGVIIYWIFLDKTKIIF